MFPLFNVTDVVVFSLEHNMSKLEGGLKLLAMTVCIK